MELVKCVKCAEEKPRDAFPRCAAKRNGLSSWCKECTNERQRKRWTDGKGNKDSRWKSRIKHRYGLSKEGFDKLWDANNGRCHICTTQLTVEHSGYAIDHNHETGEVRGLLCPTCNSGLGHFKDSIGVLEAAIEYLKAKGSYGQSNGSTEAPL
jgi:hypothetical protein